MPGTVATLRFPAESFPALGVTENRSWAVTGGAHPMLHGTLVFHTSKNVLARVNELLPKSLVSNVSRVTFRPAPKVIQADPVVQYTLPTQAGQTVTETYDIPIATSDVSMSAMQRWAAEQIAQTGDVYREAHKLMSMGIAPAKVAVPAGSQVQLQLIGKLADGTPAPSVAFGGATFSSANPAIATVSKTGAVTGVAAGTTKVVAKLGTLSATVPVTVTDGPAPTQVPLSSGDVSPTPGPTQFTAGPQTPRRRRCRPTLPPVADDSAAGADEPAAGSDDDTSSGDRHAAADSDDDTPSGDRHAAADSHRRAAHLHRRRRRPSEVSARRLVSRRAGRS